MRSHKGRAVPLKLRNGGNVEGSREGFREVSLSGWESLIQSNPVFVLPKKRVARLSKGLAQLEGSLCSKCIYLFIYLNKQTKNRRSNSVEEITKRSYNIICAYIFNLYKRVSSIKNGSFCLLSRVNPVGQAWSMVWGSCQEGRSTLRQCISSFPEFPPWCPP